MTMHHRNGIEFCVDPAWRQTAASVAVGIAKVRGQEPSELAVPGISLAAEELFARLIGADVPFQVPELDLKGLGIYL